MLQLFKTFDEDLVKVALDQLLIIKKEALLVWTLYKEKVLNNFTAITLNQRICECFEQLIEVWMTTDNFAHYFAFNIKGFDEIFSHIA